MPDSSANQGQHASKSPGDGQAWAAALQAAAAAGDAEAMYNLGVLAIEMDTPDVPAARRWYAQAAALATRSGGSSRSANKLARLTIARELPRSGGRG